MIKLIKPKKHNSFLTNLFAQEGFSLLEVMVAAGILGVISVGVMQLNQNMGRSSKRMNQQLDIVQLANKVQPLISDNITCRLSFSGRPLINGGSATGTNGILNDKSESVIKVGDIYGDLTVTRITFSDVEVANPAVVYNTRNPTNPSAPAIPTLKRSARIRIDLKRGTSTDDRANRQATVGVLETAQFFETTFFVRNVSPYQEIIDCSGKATGFADEACRILKGQFDGDRCRSINITNSTSPANQFAASFEGNVRIIPGSGGTAGTLSVANSLTVNGATALSGNLSVGGTTTFNGVVNANNRVNVSSNSLHGLCLTGRGCVTTWNVIQRSCTTHAANGSYNVTCPANSFMRGTGYYAYNPFRWVITCCTANVR